MAHSTTERPTVDQAFGEAAERLASAAERARVVLRRGLFGDEAAPRVVADRYRLGQRLGAGGQGTVWRAHDEHLRRDVAIKTLHVRPLATPERTQRWLRHEARMLSRISHPNVITVFDVGLCSCDVFGIDDAHGEMLFVVMEYVHGESLREWLDRRRPEIDEILAIMLQVARGLDAVHRAGLVHCDVKPNNVLVSDGIAKLADFGLAHASRAVVDEVPSDAVAHGSTLFGSVDGSGTAGGPVGGTPRYMAPESFVASHSHPTGDEYALAVTIFELAFGRTPHHGETTVALLEAKRSGAPPCPDPRFGQAAYAALARSLSAEPARRHGGAVALVDAILTARRRRRRPPLIVLATVPVVAVVAVAGAATSKRCDDATDRARTSTAAATLRGLSDGGDAARRMTARARARIEQHERALTEVRAAACSIMPPPADSLGCLARVDATTTALLDALGGLGEREAYRAMAIADRLPDPQQCLHPSPDAIEFGPTLAPDDDDGRRAWTSLSRARAQLLAGEPTEALATLDALVADPQLGSLANEVALARGDALEIQGRYDEASAVYRAVYERALADDEPLDAARAAGNLAHLFGRKEYRFDDGLQWVRHAEAQLTRVPDVPWLHADLRNTHGMILLMREHSSEAKAELERALALAREGTSGAAERREGAILLNLAIARVSLGDPEGLTAMREACDTLARALGEDHPDVVDAEANLGIALARFGSLDDGHATLVSALARREAIHGKDAVENARLLSAIAELEQAQGDLGAARDTLTRAIELRSRTLPPSHPDLLSLRLMEVELLLARGDVAAASEALARQTDVAAAELTPEHPVSLKRMQLAGTIARTRGDLVAAASLFEELLAHARASGVVDEPLLLWLVDAAEVAALRGDRVQLAAYLAEIDRTDATLDADVRARVDALR